MRYLEVEDVLVLADCMGLSTRDVGLLASAVSRPSAIEQGSEIYPTLHHKIAVLLEEMNKCHPMVNGCKQLSWVCAIAFARINYFDLCATQDEIYEIVMDVVEGKIEVPELAEWIESHLHVRP